MKRTTSYSRRQLLKHASLLTFAGLFPLPSIARGSKVVVVGAGLSGLYAARLLEQQGVEVTVLEGRQRTGGRVHTLDHIPGHPEAGANIIGPNYGRTINCARELGVNLQVPPRGQASGTGLLIDGHSVSRESWPASEFNHLPEKFRSISPDRLRAALLGDNPVHSSVAWRSGELSEYDISAASFFRSKGLDDWALQLIDINNSYGNSLQETSLLSLYRVSAGIRRAMAMRQPVFEVNGGNTRLTDAMAVSLKRAPLLGETVREIRQSLSGVKLDCESGHSFEADFVICAMPATAVRKMVLSPALPSSRQQGFRDVVYHKVTQAHLFAEKPYWVDSGEPANLWTNGPLGRVFCSPVADGSDRHNIVVWINGDDCDPYDVMNEEEAAAAILKEFFKSVPAAKGLVSMQGLVRWAIDPFSEGTWAAWRPGQIGSLPDKLQQPHQRLFFAGEHLGVSNSGMEAAMESGERAALDVMRKLS